VFDPAKNEWSEGPALLGSGMDGFGSAALAGGDSLYATPMSGAVERLSAAGDRWELAGQLTHPRFFHRLLAGADGRMIVVGGASMAAGKARNLESLSSIVK
jgi:hypothetical protein